MNCESRHERRSLRLWTAPAEVVTWALIWLVPISFTSARPLGGTAAAEPVSTPVAGSPAMRTAAAETLIATVSAVDTRTGTLDLLTGVGHALRIRRVQLPPGMQVRTGRTAAALSTLTPGSLVRVEWRRTPAGMIASTIERLPLPAGERRP